MEEKLIRAFDVAVVFGYTTSTIKAMARRGEIPGAVFIGRHIRFHERKVREFIENGGTRTRKPLHARASSVDASVM